eukprot:m51a1_g4508 hypothetical protein (601) ;mRNA; r:391803-394792
MKLVMRNGEGRAYYVFKPSCRRCDPKPERSALALVRGRVYSVASMRDLEARGAILRPPFAPEYVLVAQDAPDTLGGSAQGFWKTLQTRLRIKHASNNSDRQKDPVLDLVEEWLRLQPLVAPGAGGQFMQGPVADVVMSGDERTVNNFVSKVVMTELFGPAVLCQGHAAKDAQTPAAEPQQPGRPAMPYWSSTSNDPRPDAPGADVVDDYDTTGDFLADYLAYARLLGVAPHPALAPNAARESDETRAAAERDAADAVRHQKRRRKKPVVKRPGQPAAQGGAAAAAAGAGGAAGAGTGAAGQEKDEAPEVTIGVCNYVIDHGTSKAMSLALRACENIGTLKLERIEAPRSSLAALTSAVASHRRARTLVLDGTDVPQVCGEHMSMGPDPLRGHPLESLASANATLSQVSLRCCRVDDAAARAIGEVLRRNTSIVSMDLWGNRIGDDGAASLALALRRNSTLLCLCLSRNRIGDAGGEVMLASLTTYVLPPDELIARKKMRLDLEQRKADLVSRRKGKPITQASQTGSQVPKSKRKEMALEEQVDEQLRALAPLEERDNQWIVAGNRTLTALLINHNAMSEKMVSAFRGVSEVNQALEHLSI